MGETREQLERTRCAATTPLTASTLLSCRATTVEGGRVALTPRRFWISGEEVRCEVFVKEWRKVLMMEVRVRSCCCSLETSVVIVGILQVKK